MIKKQSMVAVDKIKKITKNEYFARYINLMWHAKTYKLEPLKVEFGSTQPSIIFSQEDSMYLLMDSSRSFKLLKSPKALFCKLTYI